MISEADRSLLNYLFETLRKFEQYALCNGEVCAVLVAVFLIGLYLLQAPLGSALGIVGVHFKVWQANAEVRQMHLRFR